MAAPALVWFRQDLRLADNPALTAAAASKAPLLALYVRDEKTPGDWAMGGASLWWLHHSLTALAEALGKHHIRLVLRRGNAKTIVPEIVADAKIEAIYWNRCHEPTALERDEAIADRLKKHDIAVHVSNAELLCEPWTVKTKSGEPFKVYTPFWNACQAQGWDEPHGAPRAFEAFKGRVQSDALSDWNLLPTKPNWAKAFSQVWEPGEAGARKTLHAFLDDAIASYKTDRDRPDRDGTSMLSPHLHFGEIGPRQIVRAARSAADEHPKLQGQVDKFLAELGWREFSRHLLFQKPDLADDCFRPEFKRFPWTDNAKALKAWQKGQTGVPIVDAGMRQLWQIGWMHNRIRMVVASFLVKHLLIAWQAGEAWFWDTLVDADLGNNAANWQWVAGCGADAAPYFRIFNPVLQGEKFDPEGDYVKRWVPELAKLSADNIHKPWAAPKDVLAKAGITLGKDYPEPIVDLKKGRERALSAFATIRRST